MNIDDIIDKINGAIFELTTLRIYNNFLKNQESGAKKCQPSLREIKLLTF